MSPDAVRDALHEAWPDIALALGRCGLVDLRRHNWCEAVIASAAIAAREEFDKTKAARSLSDADRREHLTKASELSNRLKKVLRTLDLDGDELKAYRKSLTDLQAWIDRQPAPQRGRPPDMATERICEIAATLVDQFDLKPSRSNAETGTHFSNLLTVIAEATFPDVDCLDSKIATAVRRIAEHPEYQHWRDPESWTLIEGV